MLWQNGWGPGGRHHGWDMDALAERKGSGWTLSWLGHGCSGRTDGVWVDVIMVGTWMLGQNGWGLGGRYHGLDMDALAERMGSGWSYHGWDMDARAERMGSGWTLIIMVGTWMLWQNGWGLGGRYHVWDTDALAERMRFGWTLSGTWMLWQNGRGLGGRCHGWDLDALAERKGSGWTLSWLGHGCSGRTDAVWVDVIMVGTDGVWVDVITPDALRQHVRAYY
eukprot:s1490_g4.t1